ncbi:hypothetical protein LTR94_025038, partial [Friedmanniomyces endolithicus]
GQRAVAQVVLNRMRHPAFPSSVCGVVYSGSQRVTGCQFTFTCDGALAKTPSASGWARARSVALNALSGSVEPSVGQATHYHTLYVAPYWSPSLLKVANIGAHTFYRWKGFNGKKASFVSAYSGAEPVVSGRIPSAEDLEAPPVEVLLPQPGAEAGPAPSPVTPIVIPQVQIEPAAPSQTAAAPQPGASDAPAARTPPAPERSAQNNTTPPPPPPGERPRRRIATADW